MSQPTLNSLNQQRLINNVLRNLISSELKKHDAPCSSQTHFNAAIWSLTQLVTDFDVETFTVGHYIESDKELIREMFSLAKEEIESYNPLRNGKE